MTRRRSSPVLRCWQAAGTAVALVLLGCAMDAVGRFVLAPLLAWIGGGW